MDYLTMKAEIEIERSKSSSLIQALLSSETLLVKSLSKTPFLRERSSYNANSRLQLSDCSRQQEIARPELLKCAMVRSVKMRQV